MEQLTDLLRIAYSAAPEVRASAHNEGVVLLDTKRGVVYTANAIGSRIWHEVISGSSGRVIVDRISCFYGVPCAEVERDASAFLVELCRRELIRPVLAS